MKRFKFFKPKSESRSVKQILTRVVDYIPDFYFSQPQHINSIEYLAHHEWELTLDSLIELADESDHYFSEEFWTELAQAATQMNLIEKSNYCLKQVQRNNQDIGSGTSFSWTTIKLDDHHFQHHISQRLKNEWAADRRKKDRVQEWLHKEGVHSRGLSRSGYIYYSEKGKIAEVEYEWGTNAGILYIRFLKSWAIPRQIPLTNLEKQRIKDAIVSWSKKKGAVEVDDFDPPLKFEFSYDYGCADLTNEQNLALWKFGELVKSLIALSSDADRQRELVGAGAVADEMAEDFNSYYTLCSTELNSNKLITDELIIQLRKIDQFLAVRSGNGMPEFWDDSQLEFHPDWNTVRQMARDTLVLMEMNHLEIEFDRTEKYEAVAQGRQLVVQSTRTRLINKKVV